MLMTALALLLAGPAPLIETGTAVPADQYGVEVVTSGLDQPWNISFLPSGDMLVVEKVGRLRVIRDGVLMDAPVTGTPEVIVKGQSGFFEAEPHPDFAENNLLYLTYAVGPDKANTLVLARAVYTPTDAGGALSDLEVLFTADAKRNSGGHYGGRIAFADDDTLFLTSGEGYAYKEQAQKLDTHFGKILRLTADGEPAPGNPFISKKGALPEIWSYGHRNPQGIDIAPDGTVYANEHGPRGGDEVNVIEPGTNYGWPAITYGIDYSGAVISPYDELPGMAQPLWYWNPSIAPSSLLYYTGDDFPDWQGKLLSGALAHTHVRIADPNDPGAEQYEILRERKARVRDVAQSPDGRLYVATEDQDDPKGGEILRIVPKP
ncbi:PQQ-dependent sugar dehydrogenase [Parvularcula sp. LCG005]|uniref:PQQ-dependent sugar dehydrogenase n=1 Tax=Parvularcula sp. LCG005 TaxID=3078805 RepID=UPI0029433AB5|nr:PQQ-dependent sugar dehydrogenase [Parvularcula sp. LCG005]WOI53052.1 PQQ-dependent sugar dehydrogenase [Parvularcula sp. LCG005]